MASTVAKIDDGADQNLSLHEMFRVVGDQLLPRDVRVLKFIYHNVFPDDLCAKIHDGFTFFLALERIGRVDSSNFKYIINVLRIIVRQDLISLVTLRRRKTVEPDPVDLYLEQTARTSSCSKRKYSACGGGHQSSKLNTPTTSKDNDNDPELVPYHPADPRVVSITAPGASPESTPPSAKRRRSNRRRGTPSAAAGSDPAAAASPMSGNLLTPNASSVETGENSSMCSGSSSSAGQRETEQKQHGHQTTPSTPHQEIRKKVTCDIRLRVRAEYCHHESALQGNVFSNKPELLERQFEKFMQANTILKSRDLGSIICDIKFSELTYLDAFWRDYINGSLLEALKGVFITESLKQAVGHEAIKLLVNVDEDDYEAGRKQLLRNLQE